MKSQDERRSFLKSLFSLSAFIAGSTLSLNKNKNIKTGKISQTESQAMGAAGKRVKKIAIEEHFHTKKYLEWVDSKAPDFVDPTGAGASKEGSMRAVDLGEGRIKNMDEAGVDMQILSLSYPDLEPFNAADAIALSKIVNDELFETVKRYPERFAGYCCLPFFQDPVAAADELERAVTKLGMRGAMVNERPGQWFSDEKYEIIYERLAKLDVPIYLHQRESGEQLVPDMLNMINGNLLDKYPNLQFIIGHAGEGLPFWLWRRGRSESMDGKRSFKQKFTDHFYVTTSDQRSDILLQFLIDALGADRIMFATDYPYGSLKEHADWIDSAQISNSDREKICHLNAEKLFKL